MPAVACSTLVTCQGGPFRSPALPEVLRDGVVAWEGERLTYAGPRRDWEGSIDEELAGRTIVPGFVDCHTHLPFFGWRDDEYETRLAGRTYRDLHGSGGIPRSARMLTDASDDEVLEFCRPLVAEMLIHGTTTVELKTGYGLSVEAELRQARLARDLAATAHQTCTVTLLACHAVPDGWSREDWVEASTRELIPAAAAEGLVDAVDVYVEDIAFTVEDLERVAEAASVAALPLRVHADQLGRSGAAEAAVRLGARSADHLNHAGDDGVRALGSSSTAAVLLPTSTLLLAADPAPAGPLREAGAILALATDLNPGTSPVLSMPEAIAFGCALYRLSPLEALAAATVNAAYVLGLGDRVGSLAPGRRADFVVLDAEDARAIPYRPGHNPVIQTFVGGQISH
ncbi:MAG TPA: imidazolonepropionase [Actinomycetota bacterium]|nr:imidazolonepropionase [Actinomycetota bacterium]